MADLYDNWAELAAAETAGVDYQIRQSSPAGATWASIAIHGGGIEPGSGEMAREVAGTQMRYYELDGMKPADNVDLHITSTNYDEPNALAMVGAVRRCLSFHGYRGDDGVPMTAIGGLDASLVARVTRNLTAAGFGVVTAASEIAGTNPANICNKTASSGGVQLEMSQALRRSFFPGNDYSRAVRESGARTEDFYRYAAAVQAAYAGRALVSMGSINVSRYTLIPAPAADVDVQATVATDRYAVGGSHFLALVGRYLDGSNTYLARLEFTTAQDVNLTIRKRVAGAETLLGTTFATGLNHAPGTRFALRFQLSGNTLRARAWLADGIEPTAWQREVVDTSLTAAGSVGMRSILSSSTTGTLPVIASWADLRTPGGSQAFTVTRSVNGVVKPHSSGATVRLAHPAIASL
ncbi:poly-gamma-glutamate hydrolase family protein [Streptomyces alfalfae]|uniref:poly-gamma-glutamate hydrolase family protein n=1 Tax=Streptomyces alfalfae TaxID=1642299 RepID=UPI001BAD3DA4|nr:poly-gamma-glutamate hydrolase family protein [Streptomyces alfalfae]QUI32429.1 poly-gamma-glutamate hydrolase family protein [Streptomyces alfalfae]